MLNFLRKVKEEVKEVRIRVSSSTERPKMDVIKISEEDLVKMSKVKKIEKKVDPYFLQEVVDRICGPDSEEYKNAIIELNEKFKTRVGKTGRKIFE